MGSYQLFSFSTINLPHSDIQAKYMSSDASKLVFTTRLIVLFTILFIYNVLHYLEITNYFQV